MFPSQFAATGTGLELCHDLVGKLGPDQGLN
jgi:hypothetical protein